MRLIVIALLPHIHYWCSSGHVTLYSTVTFFARDLGLSTSPSTIDEVIKRTRRSTITLIPDRLVSHRKVTELSFWIKLIEKVELNFHGDFQNSVQSHVGPNICLFLVTGRFDLQATINMHSDLKMRFVQDLMAQQV
ncbi:hypothetical protein [Undibacterium sp. TS12]|uniref:hypothetical protein n=1 Tax=Undibacterium sp. TS12 TaxID=2908202 RepID=UPI001F4CE134|nr:hypothetical protein [Undibacterium sp. TS12]MCH8617908.1 hypothetical protein [Undibacterium sp. TS12]